MGWKDAPEVGQASPAWMSAPEVGAEPNQPAKPAQPTFGQLLKAEVMTGPAGGLARGLKDIVDTGAGFLSKLGGSDEAARVKSMNEAGTADFRAAQDLAGAGTSDAFRVGGQVLGTAPVGGVLAAPVKAAARAIPALQPLATAIASSGMSTGRAVAPGALRAAGDLGIRAAGGAITGGASAGLVDPEQAGAGAAFGAALPVAVKGAAVAGQKIGRGAAALIKNGLGLSTGVGAEPVAQAFKAGRAGDKTFLANMRGEVPLTDVLDEAKQGLSAMRAAKSAEYRSGMIPIAGDKSVLTLGAIDKALQDAVGVTAFKGKVKNEAAASAVAKMRGAIDEWRALDPAEFHTPEGLDALKQKLGGIIEEIPFEQRTARLAAGKVYDAAKNTIQEQAPTYAKVMKEYAEASSQINEIERALSLGDRASKDTAMRKLQSLMRNNVQTNYGNRLTLANTLEQKGGVDLMPALAGQAMNSLTPRSLAGQVGGGATTLAAMMTANPMLLAGLPLQSPRVVGSMAYGAGRMAGGAGRALRGGAMAGSPDALANEAALEQLFANPELKSLLYRAAPVAMTGR